MRWRRGTLSRNTLLSYQADFEVFRNWCRAVQRQDLPATPETLALFIADQLDQGKKVATATRRARGIAHAHKSKDLPSPLNFEVRAILRGAQGLTGGNFSPHSMRSGFITAAGEEGVSHLLIAAQTGHRSLVTLQRYFRRTNLFRANAAGMIGL